MSMHQVIEEQATLIDKLIHIIDTMDFLQGELLLRDLGGFDTEHFVLRGTSCCFSLKSMNKSINNATRLMREIPITFEGGPTSPKKFNGTVATFVTDRVLRCIDLFGYEKISKIVTEVLNWGQCDEERYAG